LVSTSRRAGRRPEDALAHARVLAAGNGAERQRYVAARNGVDGVLAWLAHETCQEQPQFSLRTRHVG
jgi:hypothetical protein